MIFSFSLRTLKFVFITLMSLLLTGLVPHFAFADGDVFSNDLYLRLGVSRNATADEIKLGYRRMSNAYHPDKHPGDPNYSSEMVQRVREAYDVLKDAASRVRYNRNNPYAGLTVSAKPRENSTAQAQRGQPTSQWSQWTPPEFDDSTIETYRSYYQGRQQAPNENSRQDSESKTSATHPQEFSSLDLTTVTDWAAAALATSPNDLSLENAIGVFSQKMPSHTEKEFLVAIINVASSGPRPRNQPLASAAEARRLYQNRYEHFMKTCKTTLAP